MRKQIKQNIYKKPDTRSLINALNYRQLISADRFVSFVMTHDLRNGRRISIKISRTRIMLAVEACFFLSSVLCVWGKTDFGSHLSVYLSPEVVNFLRTWCNPSTQHCLVTALASWGEGTEVYQRFTIFLISVSLPLLNTVSSPTKTRRVLLPKQ